MRLALNKDLEALSKVYAERGEQLARQGEHRIGIWRFLLTGLGAALCTLIVVGMGVLIVSGSVARPLSVITATIKAGRRGRRRMSEVPHTAGRRDRAGIGEGDAGIFKGRWTETAISIRRS